MNPSNRSLSVSKATVLAIAPFLAGTAISAPTALDNMLPHDQVNDVVKYLDSKGQIEWTEVDGGNITSFTHDVGLQAANAISSRDQKTSPSGWFTSHDWTSVGEIDGHSTKTACIGSGDKFLTSIVAAGASAACNNLLSKSTAGVLGNKGWNVYKQSKLADTTGANGFINWRWADLSAGTRAVPLTKTLCNTAINELLDGSCVGGGQTQGGSIEVAESLGWILGFDPNNY
ncbi:putative phosphatidylserine decarboxylase protein [Seiridium unicorne]|uniref:Phosphatidylserine decarboxylase protein n=1 Tax=Seiridium unicorne TaxID=138068 RepID=A0ABR2VDF5_9PEZI